jgi:pilus assembly protein CpaC
MQERIWLYSIGLLLASTAAIASLAHGQEEARLTIGKSIVVDYPTDISRISMSNAAGPSMINTSDALKIFALRPDLKLAIFLKALQNPSLLQIPAEPNLFTANDRESSFVLGYEFPIPILQGGSNPDVIPVQFMTFGKRLNFNLFITKNNTIKLYVKPEVSTHDIASGASFSGCPISAPLTGTEEHNIEFSAWLEFCDRHLIDNRVTEIISKISGLSSLPIFRNLTRRKEGDDNNTELLVPVTPGVIMPLQPGEAKPAMPRNFLTPNGTEEPFQSKSKGRPSNKGADSDMRNIE